MIKKSSSSEEREKENQAILDQLIPFSFDSLSETVIEKVRNILHKIDKALRIHKDPKDRVKELRVIGSKLGFDLNRKSEEFLLVEAAAITNVAMKDEGKNLMQYMDEFLAEFPEFGGLPLEERELLLHYRNMMKISMQVIPAKWNYNHLLALVARIAEGAKVRYVTGSGATDQTKYRMMIYEKISGIPRQKRPEKQYEPLMNMLKSGSKTKTTKQQDCCEDSSVSSDSNSNTSSIGSSYSFTDLPVREKSIVVSPGLYMDSKEAQMSNGTVVRSSSVTRKSEAEGGLSTIEMELSRSASITSTGFGDFELPLFENLHDDLDFSFLGSIESSSNYQLDHQSIYTDTGSVCHNVAITEYTGYDNNLEPNGFVSPASIDLASSQSEQGCITRKRKVNSDSDELNKEHAVRKLCPNQTERYNCLIEKLSEDIFHRESNGHTVVPGQEPLSNYDFIIDVLRPRLAELEDIVATEDNPNQVTKRMKNFASSVGVDPLSRFNDKFLIVEVALILLLSSRAEHQNLKISSERFISEHPEFLSETPTEQELLFTYRNMLAAALKVIPGKWNSNHLLDVVTRIVEGKDKKYVTGSGATKQTRNRIEVYHNLTGIEKQSKPVTFVNSVFQYLSDSAGNSSASSSDEKGNEAEENAGFWPGPTQKVLKNFESTVGIAEREKRRTKNDHYDGIDKARNNNDNNDNTMTNSTTSRADSSLDQFEVRKAHCSVPNIPDVKISTTEMKSTDDSVSCKTTTVFREFTDAVTGMSFKCELARGVSVTQQSMGSFDLFDNLDLFEDHAVIDPSVMDVSAGNGTTNGTLQRQATRDRSEFDMQCIAMLQEHGQSGVRLHRETSGTSNGVVRNISLTKQFSDETMLTDNFGQTTEILSLLRSSSIMPVDRDSSYHLLSPKRDQSLIKLI